MPAAGEGVVGGAVDDVVVLAAAKIMFK